MPSYLAGMDPLVPVFCLVGLIGGVGADRLAARWPAHEDGSARKLDWRTVFVALFAAVALAPIPQRFGDPAQRALFGVVFAACVVLMATDLDQKLMPDVVNLPLILIGVAALIWGGDSLVSRSPAWLAVLGAVVIPGLLFAASIPFGDGAFGGGDVKFLAAMGLLLGLTRLVLAVFAGVMLSGVIVMALLATRRITLKSYIPFGPFLIVGAVWAALLPASS